MNERISTRFVSRNRNPHRHDARRSDLRSNLARGPIGPLTAVVLAAAFYGCASPGSALVSTGGTTGTATGGSSVTGSGGSDLAGTGGSDVTGTGGSDLPGTGGDIGTGTGTGGTSTGSGGNGVGSGGGGVLTGGRTGSGGSIAGSGGRPGTGGVSGTGGAVVGPACPKPAGQICHEFLANDNGRNQINYVNEFDPTKNWTKPVGDTGANSPRTIEIVDNAKGKTGKAILVSLEKGYGEFDVVDGTLLARVANKAGVSGACRMPDGSTALGIDTAIAVVNATGTELRRIPIPQGDNLRATNRNPTTGHFWFSKTNLIYDISDTGTITWMGNMGVNTKGYAVWWRTGGGAYATTGDPSTVIEMDTTGAILNTVGGKAKFASTLALDFFSGFVRLANGNYVVANWLGHLSAPAASTPHLVEFTPANVPVWQWGNQTLARQITNVYVFR